MHLDLGDNFANAMDSWVQPGSAARQTKSKAHHSFGHKLWPVHIFFTDELGQCGSHKSFTNASHVHMTKEVFKWVIHASHMLQYTGGRQFQLSFSIGRGGRGD